LVSVLGISGGSYAVFSWGDCVERVCVDVVTTGSFCVGVFFDFSSILLTFFFFFFFFSLMGWISSAVSLEDEESVEGAIA